MTVEISVLEGLFPEFLIAALGDTQLMQELVEQIGERAVAMAIGALLMTNEQGDNQAAKLLMFLKTPPPEVEVNEPDRLSALYATGRIVSQHMS